MSKKILSFIIAAVLTATVIMPAGAEELENTVKTSVIINTEAAEDSKTDETAEVSSENLFPAVSAEAAENETAGEEGSTAGTVGVTTSVQETSAATVSTENTDAADSTETAAGGNKEETQGADRETEPENPVADNKENEAGETVKGSEKSQVTESTETDVQTVRESEGLFPDTLPEAAMPMTLFAGPQQAEDITISWTVTDGLIEVGSTNTWNAIQMCYVKTEWDSCNFILNPTISLQIDNGMPEDLFWQAGFTNGNIYAELRGLNDNSGTVEAGDSAFFDDEISMLYMLTYQESGSINVGTITCTIDSIF